ncbi:LiaI-LiaF-like domain-containing protein [Lentibacillus sp. Marseille-P4043]|uniref:LiaI-LiaF-like domain-containing protein n=1 Tax=Lentibacillus sp. Marseille-P4043 TaxID=2040293 RepID=UPI000D0B85C9|nr:DUF5668 domain-containing protein [Lentibacillus sp. Marseille-P4043]
MKKQNSFAGYLLIGLGAFFLLRELKLPIVTDFYSWTTLLIIIGLALLIHSYSSKDYQNLFTGTIILGLGIHFHGVNHYTFWIDHWAVYPLIVGIAFIVRYLRTKKGLLPGVILVIVSLLLIFSIRLPVWFNWIYTIVDLIERFWPIIIIIIGIYFLKKRK